MNIFLDSEIMNLSKGGLFLRADIPLATGSEVDFEFTLPHTRRSVRAVGTVVWARKGKKVRGAMHASHPSGMGVQFKDIGISEMEAILDEIEQLLDFS